MHTLFFSSVLAASTFSVAVQADTVYLPPGSGDALEAACVTAGPGGTVIVQTGMHWEYDQVTISIPVAIMGEAGSVMEIASTPGTVFPLVVDAGLHVLDTTDVTIRDLELRPILGTQGGCAVRVEDSTEVLIAENEIEGHQFGIMVQWSPHAHVRGNFIQSSVNWQTGEYPYAFGISVLNGDHVRIDGNSVFDAQAGIFASDEKGRIQHNVLTRSGFGIVLCNIPEGAFDISGDLQGSNQPATRWQIHNNLVQQSTLHGMQLIHGARDNKLVNNLFLDNAVLDVELTDSSYHNWIVTGSRWSPVVQDCGTENRILGQATIIDC